MEYPFILYRTKDNRSVAALCSKCAEDQVLTACPHEGMDRAITGVVYFFHIFPYALGNGGLRRHSPVGIILHLIFTGVDGALMQIASADSGVILRCK